MVNIWSRGLILPTLITSDNPDKKGMWQFRDKAEGVPGSEEVELTREQTKIGGIQFYNSVLNNCYQCLT